MHMRRDDGVIFKLRKDGQYQIVIPKQPRRKKPRRR
jgi:predicted  nucleic acid-binding Zn-ribbon protein